MAILLSPVIKSLPAKAPKNELLLPVERLYQVSRPIAVFCHHVVMDLKDPQPKTLLLVPVHI